MSAIVVKRDGYIFEGEHYEKVPRKLSEKRLVIIEEKRLLAKVSTVDEQLTQKTINEYVDELIKNQISEDRDLLFDYLYDKKKNKLYIYAIKSGSEVKRLLSGARKAKVVPVQYMIKDIVQRNKKTLVNYICIAKIREYVYFIKVKDGYIVSTDVGDIDEKLEIYLNIELSREESIILDKRLKDKIQKYNIDVKDEDYIDIGELVNARISKKQRFSTPKLLRRNISKKREK